METKILKSFAVVAETNSFSRAAAILQVSQPALSRQIKLLEADFGAALLHRNGRGVTLTPAGLALKARTDVILSEVEQARSDVIEILGTPSGRVTLGLTPLVGQIIAAPMLRYFANTYPDLKLTVIEGLSGHLCEWLVSGRIDIGVVDIHHRSPALFTETLVTEDLSLLGPGGGAALPDEVGFDDLSDYPLILTTKQHSLRQQIDRLAAEHGLPLRIAFEVDTFTAIKRLVQDGYGYAIAPINVVETELVAGQLTATPIVRPNLRRTLHLAMSPHCNLTFGVRVVCGQLRRLGQQLVGAPADLS